MFSTLDAQNEFGYFPFIRQDAAQLTSQIVELPPSATNEVATAVTSQVPTAEETSSGDAAAATSIKPAAEISAPTTTSSPSHTVDDVEAGWGFFTYLFFFAVLVGAGFLLWWLGAIRFVMHIFNKQSGKAKYRRVDDLEK